MKIGKILPIIIILFIISNCNNLNNKQQSRQTLLQELSIERKNKAFANNTKLKEPYTKNNDKTNPKQDSVIAQNNTIETKPQKDSKIQTKPQFKEIIIDAPDELLTKKYLKSISSAELNLIRAKIYEKYDYNFYKIWGENFYKEKYGYIVKPKGKILKKLNKQDSTNEANILKQLRVNYKTKKLSLPIYIGHILREVSYNKNKQRYFQSIEDAKPLAKPFNKDNNGIVKPIPQKEISTKEWFNLVNGRKRFFELNIPIDKERLYLVYYYNKNNIKYIISYEAFFGQIGPQDIKNFSIYDRKGILRRNIFVGNQETYEKDYLYNEQKEIYKVVEKIIQTNSFITVNIYELN